MNEYRIKVTIRNNLLLGAIEGAGYKSQSDFAREVGVSPTSITNLVSMRHCPINSDGEFTPDAKKVMEVLGACPSDLWTDEQLTMRLNKNTTERNIGRDVIQWLLEDNISTMTLPDPSLVAESAEMVSVVSAVLENLTCKEREVIIKRNGIGNGVDKGLHDIAGEMGLSVGRVRQIEMKAMRKMRDPYKKSRAMLDALM